MLCGSWINNLTPYFCVLINYLIAILGLNIYAITSNKHDISIFLKLHSSLTPGIISYSFLLQLIFFPQGFIVKCKALDHRFCLYDIYLLRYRQEK